MAWGCWGRHRWRRRAGISWHLQMESREDKEKTCHRISWRYGAYDASALAVRLDLLQARNIWTR